eukprot:5779919-Amphidinium_carterae.1
MAQGWESRQNIAGRFSEAEECKGDREIVPAAVGQNGLALKFAAEERTTDQLLLDSTFVPEVKRNWWILKVSMLSCRSTVVLARSHNRHSSLDLVLRCYYPLGFQCSGRESLVHGAEVVPATGRMEDWPGLRPKREVSEYQLVIGAQ